jgi:ureidoglycolate lyase
VDVDANNGRPAVSIFRSTPLPCPLVIHKMERHPLSSQAFIPLTDNPYLVVVAPPGKFDRNRIEVFVAQSHQGVNYHRGTWHHFCLALNDVSDFLVIDRSGDGNNCDESSVDGGLEILAARLPK